MKAILQSLCLGGLLLAAVPVSVCAEPPAAIDGVVLPDTAPGHAMAEWLTAFNAGDVHALAAFQTRYQSPPAEPQMILGFLRLTGGFRLIRVEASEPTRLSALVIGKADEKFARFDIRMDGATPPRITSLDINLTPTPADLLPARLPDAALPAALKARMQTALTADTFSGVVLVAKDGRPIFSDAGGEADRASHRPVTPDTQFRIGSMNKMFTAVAILQMVDAGKIRLDDPLGKYLSAYPNSDTARVTIRQLLTHTGGTGDIFTPEYMAARLTTRTHGDYIALFGKRAPEFTPGDHHAYSNYGFILLGAIIEKVSGQDYYTYVDAHVFRPAGMTRTASLPEDVDVPGRAIGYMRGEDGRWIPNTDTLPYRGTSAGGGYSTAGDLLKFAVALQSGKLLKPETLAMASGPQVKARGENSYGFGFMADSGGAYGFYGHNGGAPGINGELRIYPRAGYVIIALSNLDPPSAGIIANHAGERVGGP